MKELTSNTGGRYLFFDDIADLQNSALSSASAIFFGKGNFVISGCKVSGNSISAGYVYLDGKIREVPATSGLSFPLYIVPKNTTEQGMYLDSAAEQDTAVIYGVQFTTTYNATNIRFTSEGADSTMEKVLFSGLSLDGDMSLGNLNVSDRIKFKASGSAQTGELYYGTNGFNLSTGIITGTGTFSGNVIAPKVTAKELFVPQTDGGTIGMSITYNLLKFIVNTEGTTTSSIKFTEYGFEFDKHIQIEDYLAIRESGAASHNALYGPHSIHYSYASKQLLQWGDSGQSGSYLRTEQVFTVAGINGDGAILNVQKQTARANEPTYKTTITESTLMCYSPATADYQNNRSGYDWTGGEAILYIHGHAYKLGVSPKGFLYDKNNPEFVDPIASGGGSSSGSTVETLAVATLDDVSVINWKKTEGDSTWSGKLHLSNNALTYDGNMKVGGGMSITGGLVVGSTANIKDVYTETIRIKNDTAYVQGKAGVTTIYNYTNLRFQISQGTSASSKIVKLLADKLTCTYIGGILTATVMNAGEVLSGFTEPHPVELVTQ